jgi:ribonuclease-3
VQESRNVVEFCRHYGLTFRDPRLLKLALTHRSYLHVTGQRDSNERLEFLGDSVLGLVTSEFLYRAHPAEHEGQLTKTKSLLVSKAILSRRALAMGLGRFVFMSHSEVESGGRQRLSILADAFESVVGAIYLDQGFGAARAFIERWLLRDTRTIVADKRHTNYKSHLQEYVQSTYRTHPVYRIRSEMGPDHSKQFMVEVIVGKRTLGEGKGRNKKEAEQAAARNALERVESGPVSDRGMRQAARSERVSAPGISPGIRPQRPTRRPPVEEETEPDREASRSAPETRTPMTGGTAEEGEERQVVSSRRRRGRRGGRGRRTRPAEESPATLEAGTEAVIHPAIEPRVSEPIRRTETAARVVTPPVVSAPAPRADMPREVEPPPRPFDEDENEEVGRPEGPREQAQVDPYAWDRPETRREPFMEPPPPTPVRESTRLTPVRETTEFAPSAMESEAPLPGEEEDAESSSAPGAEPPPRSSPPVSYGRRPGRSRR